MLRAIFYKEWLKTRWYYLVAVLLSLSFVGYVLLNFFRAAGLKGIAHLWEVMLLRDAVFVDLLQFVPLVVGLLFAVVQFVPEMQRKCLKLTLHLPHRGMRRGSPPICSRRGSVWNRRGGAGCSTVRSRRAC